MLNYAHRGSRKAGETGDRYIFEDATTCWSLQKRCSMSEKVSCARKLEIIQVPD